MLSDLRILPAREIISALANQELALVEIIRETYLALASGNASLPHSCFLRFEDGSADRIIALPAYLMKPQRVAGLKWISSIPSNPDRGIDRASGLIVINDRETGRATSILEGSVISAKRTAASAALAAMVLTDRMHVDAVGLIGLGAINFEVVRFLRAAFPALRHLHAYDRNPAKTAAFSGKCTDEFPGIRVTAADSAADAIRGNALVSIATTATRPHIDTLDGVQTDAVILHLSLRDFAVDAILAADNVVDDIDHVCRADTSVHLASQRVGHRDFMTDLAKLIMTDGAQRERRRPVIFSPFGLGVLDLAVASMVVSKIQESGGGTVVNGFHPQSWRSR